jgi:type IV secretory pathway VirB2 component (pilin)
MSLSLSLADPPNTSVILSAARWIEAVLIGNLATTIAIVAVASIGFAMLTGRVDVRRGGTIILGCFILFGASTIANGLRNAAQNSGNQYSVTPPVPPPVFVRPQKTDAANPGYDPYAGASVPQQ